MGWLMYIIEVRLYKSNPTFVGFFVCGKMSRFRKGDNYENKNIEPKNLAYNHRRNAHFDGSNCELST